MLNCTSWLCLFSISIKCFLTNCFEAWCFVSKKLPFPLRATTKLFITLVLLVSIYYRWGCHSSIWSLPFSAFSSSSKQPSVHPVLPQSTLPLRPPVPYSHVWPHEWPHASLWLVPYLDHGMAILFDSPEKVCPPNRLEFSPELVQQGSYLPSKT